ncbi:SOS response-associated peptidase [Phenylobacterium sp.]|uniref:SOS response-associated peptidase n=1 Tax=Phenylobacterium sp. TaxID=1871053 RepID=UPI0025D59C6C|nr:SOS response-associated peptidase family protein [Phenylobacterium sp.]
MCNLYTLDPNLIDLVEEFQRFLGLHLATPAGELSNTPWAKTVYPGYQGMFARPMDLADPGGALEPVVGRWGLVPFFHKGEPKAWKSATNNARSEDMHEKASFRDAVKSRRAIIPVTAICEWTGPKGSKTKHLITRAGGGTLFLAGLWSRHKWEGEETLSYTMVMQATAEGDDMFAFHNRQPVFLDRDGAQTWLDTSADYRPLLMGPPGGALVADPPEPVAA